MSNLHTNDDDLIKVEVVQVTDKQNVFSSKSFPALLHENKKIVSSRNPAIFIALLSQVVTLDELFIFEET